jgi:hypothetical protein
VRTIAEVIFGTFYSGTMWQASGTLELRPSRYLFVSLEYEQNNESLRECWQPGEGVNNGQWVPDCHFTQRLARTRISLSLTPEISWTNVIQYDNVSDRIGLNSVFRWEIDPGNEFFVIFNQNWDQEYSSFQSVQTLVGAKVMWTFRF